MTLGRLKTPRGELDGLSRYQNYVKKGRHRQGPKRAVLA
jgi:hypothetical protein